MTVREWMEVQYALEKRNKQSHSERRRRLMTVKKRKKMLKYRGLMLKHKLIRLLLGEVVAFEAKRTKWLGTYGTVE